MIKKLIVLLYTPIFIALLAASVWFVRNLVTAEERWNAMAPNLKSEIEDLCDTPVSKILWRGLALEGSKWAKEYLESRAFVRKLQEALRQMEARDAERQSELENLRFRMRRQEEALSALQRSRKSGPRMQAAGSGLEPAARSGSTYFQLNTNDEAEVRRRTESEVARQKAAEEEMRRRRDAETARRIAAEVEEGRRTGE